jgi:prepilin signal peptidase PulO-like enzyme (type II secretory pathway)
VGVFGGFFLGSIVALILLAMGKAKFGQKIPFAPYLVIGTLIAIFWGQRLIEWYLGFNF